MNLSDAVEQATRATGLPRTACRALLHAGWTLVMDVRTPMRWEHPERQYVRPIIVTDEVDPRTVADEVRERLSR